MSLPKIDRAAGAIKSVGTTRRAATIICLDSDHIEIETHVDRKLEEDKLAALIAAGYLSDYKQDSFRTISGGNSSHSFYNAQISLKYWMRMVTWQTKVEYWGLLELDKKVLNT